MREQSGRSLIEMIGVLALGVIIVSASLGTYRSIDQRMKRFKTSEYLHEIVKNTKTLLEYSGYEPVSVDFLIKSGALQSDKAPAGTNDWTITPSFDGTEFSINLFGLNFEECTYFTTKKFNWATKLVVNGYESGGAMSCLKTDDNTISFYAK